MILLLIKYYSAALEEELSNRNPGLRDYLICDTSFISLSILRTASFILLDRPNLLARRLACFLRPLYFGPPGVNRRLGNRIH
jgi:hypothetical protein